jgi:hypothetical protein
MRSMDVASEEIDATIRVSAPVADPDVPVWNEVMWAAPDPADPDQAVLLSVPFLVDDLNFGDLVRLGAVDDCGVRPILEVVIPSGHVRVMAATDPDGAVGLASELERTFPDHALRIEGSNGVLSVSIHPDLDPDEVIDVIVPWIAVDAEDDEEGLAISPILETRPGPIAG